MSAEVLWIIYAVGVAGTFAGGLATRSEGDSQFGARMVLAAPVWPLVVVGWVIYTAVCLLVLAIGGVWDLIREASGR